VSAFIEFVLSNFTLTFLVLGFVAAGIAILAERGRAGPGGVLESVLA
jgi:hypothetical protein